MPALTAMFSASVSWRGQAVKNTCVSGAGRQRLAQRVGGGQVRADRDHAGAGLDRGPRQGDDLPAVRGEQVDQGRSGDAGGAGDQGGPGGVLVRHDATLSCRREAAGRHADPPRYAAGGQPVGTGGGPARLSSGSAAARDRRVLVILGASPPEGIPVATLVSERIGQFFVDGDRLEYTEYGAGDRWVVLVHGQLMPRRMHQPLARAIAVEGFHVVTVDLLGHGRSDRPLDPKEYSMTAFGEQVVALLDHLGADQAVIGGTSLGSNVSLEVADVAPERVRGLLLEMPVLDNALEAGLIAFGPLMFLARFVPLSITLTRRLSRMVPRGVVPFWAGVGLDTLAQQPAPMAATIHGIFFGRIAPSSKRRRQISAPALVVGHPRDPIHPAADAAMLADEMPNARFVAARSILEWRSRPPASTPRPSRSSPSAGRPPPSRRERTPARPRRVGANARSTPSSRRERTFPAGPVGTPGCAGENGGVGLYRDEAIVLRTQKLGEADRIITLLTRQLGPGACGRQGGTTDLLTLRVAARAVHPRRPAARRGPLARRGHPGRDAGAVREPDGRGLRALHRRHGDAGDRRAAGHRGQGARPPAVPAARRCPARDLRHRPLAERRSSTPSCCARWRSPATRRPSRRARAAGSRGRTGRSARPPAACSARPAGCPVRRAPRWRRWRCSARCSPGDWAVVDASEPRHRREATGLVAAYLQWHLERGLKSIAYVQR